MLAKGNLFFRDICPDLYSHLSVLCVLCLAAGLAAVYTIQCRAASNMHYAVLSSFQRALKDCYLDLYCKSKANGTNKTQCISNTQNKSKLFGLFVLLVQRIM